MGFFHQLKKGFEHLENTSFRDVAIHFESKQTSSFFGQAEGKTKTQLERIENLQTDLSNVSSKFSNVPFVGQFASQISAASGATAEALEPLNRAIKEQDDAAKRGEGSIHHYVKIGKAGVSTLHKGHKLASKHKQVLPIEDLDQPVLHHIGEVVEEDGEIKPKKVAKKAFNLFIDSGFADDMFQLKEREDFDNMGDVMHDRYYLQQ